MSDIPQNGDEIRMISGEHAGALGFILAEAASRQYLVRLEGGEYITAPRGSFINLTELGATGSVTISTNEQETSMTNAPLPSETPNVVVENPTVRKVAGNTLAVASLVLAIATLVDGAIAEIDYGNVTGPAAIIIAGLFGIFQLGVTSPNVPKV